MTKTKGVAPEKRSKKQMIRWTPSEFALISARALESGICDADYVRTLALDTPASKAPRRITISDKNAQAIIIAFNKWGPLVTDVQETLSFGDLPYASVMHQIVLAYRELHTAVLEMIEASR